MGLLHSHNDQHTSEEDPRFEGLPSSAKRTRKRKNIQRSNYLRSYERKALKKTAVTVTQKFGFVSKSFRNGT